MLASEVTERVADLAKIRAAPAAAGREASVAQPQPALCRWR